MEKYTWLILLVFIALVIHYLNSSKQKEEKPEPEGEKELYGIGGVYNGRRIVIGEELTIGRDPGRCSIVYPDGAKGVSAVHCSIKVRDAKVELTDLSSTYGTFQGDGKKLEPNKTYRLETGDRFYVGDKENTFIVR